jgi:hypothetical protein
VAAIKAKWVFQTVEAFAGSLIAAVRKPAIGLQQDRWTEIAVLVPPIAWACGRAAEAKNAFPRSIELGALLWRLTPFAIGRRLIGLEPGLDQLVLRIQPAKVGDEILQNLQVRQRRDPARAFLQAVHGCETGQRVYPVDVHRAGAAHALAARPPKRQRRVDLVVDLDQGIEDHRPAVIAIDVNRSIPIGEAMTACVAANTSPPADTATTHQVSTIEPTASAIPVNRCKIDRTDVI